MAEKSLSRFLVCCFVGILMMGSNQATDEEVSSPPPPTSFSFVAVDFALQMLKAQSRMTEGNVILSPHSVATLLVMLQQGARGNTLEELNKAIGLSPEESLQHFQAEMKALLKEKKDVTLESGNRLYIKSGFEVDDQFNKTMTEIFGTSIETIDFLEPSTQAVAEKINGWVREATKDNVKNLITPAFLTPNTIFLVLNAIFFKGLWDVPFKKSYTKPNNFELTAGEFVQVPFMAQKERFIAGEDPETGLQWVDLPFKDEQFSMLFLLPREKHDLSRVMERLNTDLFLKIMEDHQTRQVTLQLPKFKLSQNVVVAGALKQLGVKDIFSGESNLQGITPNYKNLVVSKIVHSASVEIDEDGSTASGATALGTEVLSFPKSSDHLDFKADHPFLFFILDRANNVPIFVGKVVNPSL